MDELAHELSEGHESGQPVIDEQHFARTGKIRASVFWDKWDAVPHEERAEIIHQLYRTGSSIGSKRRTTAESRRTTQN